MLLVKDRCKAAGTIDSRDFTVHAFRKIASWFEQTSNRAAVADLFLFGFREGDSCEVADSLNRRLKLLLQGLGREIFQPARIFRVKPANRGTLKLRHQRARFEC